MQLGGQTLL